MPESTGNTEQVRVVADQVADRAISRFVAEHPEVRKTEIPPPLKWAAGIIAGLMMMGIGGTATWLVSTVNEMQVTLARVDERMANQSISQAAELVEVKRRVSILEGHASERNRE